MEVLQLISSHELSKRTTVSSKMYERVNEMKRSQNFEAIQIKVLSEEGQHLNLIQYLITIIHY